MNERAPNLSPEGRARRESMRGELIDELLRTRQRRQLRRQISGSIAVITLVVGTSWLALNRSTPTPQPTTPLTAQIVRTETAITSSWIVRTDPSALASATSAAPSNIKIERISDDQLITQLAAIGKTTGIARTGDRVWLTDDIFAEP